MQEETEGEKEGIPTAGVSVLSEHMSSTDVSSSRHPQAAAANFLQGGPTKKKYIYPFRKKAQNPPPPPLTEASRRQEEEKSYFVSQLRLHIKEAE